MRAFALGRRARGQLAFIGVQVLSVLALLLALLSLARPLLYVLLAVIVGYTWWKGRKVAWNPYLGVRVLAVASILVDAVRHDVRPTPWLLLPSAVLLLLMLVEFGVRRRTRRSTFAVNLPDALRTRSSSIRGGPLLLLTNVLIVLLAVAVLCSPLAVGPAMWVAFAVLTVVGALLVSWLVVHDVRRRSTSAINTSVREALIAHRPTFLVYFSAPAGSTYQVTMWLPYLERLGEPFYILTRERRHLNALRDRTDVPIVHAASLGAMENAVVPGVSTVFYVNNGMKNSHCVRLSHLAHVQLLHGDSDKPPSYSPVTAMYDKVFVAGQAGIDRYEKHGVLIHEDKFVIVGRPQVEDIEVVQGPVPSAGPVVLYAPTWKGQYSDSSLSSLPRAEEIVSALLRLGATVVFRPHPYSSRDPESRALIARVDALLAASAAADGRPHRYGAAATTELSIVECLNLSDAMVTDVSSVAADYLFSRKPFAITDVGLVDGDIEEAFPLARAAYLLREGEDATTTLELMLGADPLAARRGELRAYYLGDLPDQGYADVFVTRALEVVHERGQHEEIDDEVELERANQADMEDELAESDE